MLASKIHEQQIAIAGVVFASTILATKTATTTTSDSYENETLR